MDSLVICEGCANYISVKEINVVFPCPICGCLTLATPASLEVLGTVKLESPLVVEDIDLVKRGAVTMEGYPDEVKEAVAFLCSKGWKMTFTGA
jgi:hypothetical protein